MSHLRQSKNPRCRESLQELEAHPQQSAADLTEHSHLDPLDNDDDEPASPLQAFVGDFFGEHYGPADLPGWDHGEFDEAFNDRRDEAELPDQ